MARQKRLLDQEEDEFADRLANARKREEIVRRKEKGRVIKKAVRPILILGRICCQIGVYISTEFVPGAPLS